MLSAEVSFNRDIRPIMADTCFRCHGPDHSSRKAGLRLDLREEAIKRNAKNTAPIVPGDPDKSLIIQRIFSDSKARIMPPAAAHKELSDKQKQTIRHWVAEGAKYEGHWAYQPLKRPAVPQSKASNPIDAFVHARLEQEHLQPSPEADRRTLLRRVTLDLTGIPPTFAEYEAFAADKSPQAYEKVVDRLLASPRYAEQQTLHWLDAVRYADTSGFHGDNAYPVWPYRDYVLNSFRKNKPFDQFTIEQLAGDLLPNATIEQKVASAFNRLNRTSAEGGVQPKEYLAKYAADRVRTTSAVWLGSTTGCAECHDHKFDPFTSKDFYSLQAFFADIKETGLVPDRGPRAWGSQLELPTPAQKAKLEALNRAVKQARRDLEDKSENLVTDEWMTKLRARYKAGEFSWRYQRPTAMSTANGAQLNVVEEKDDTVIAASGPNPDRETYTVTLKPGAGSWTSVGIEGQSDESLPGSGIARGSDRFILTEVEAELIEPGKPARKLPFILATSNLSFQSKALPAMAAIDGDQNTGWGISTYGDNNRPFLALRLAANVTTSADSSIIIRLHQQSRQYRRATLGRFRIALASGQYSWPISPDRRAKNKTPGGFPADVLTALQTDEQERTPAMEKALRDYLVWSDPRFITAMAALGKLERDRDMLDAAIPRVMIPRSVEPREIRILAHGNFLDASGPIVTPAIPAVFGKVATKENRATRLDLARWLVSKDNPLTARVQVNRMWRLYFGIGLTKTLDDLGSQGEWPTHPELLDWLAAEFANGWDMKHMIRTIVTSQTYRQSSLSNAALNERDPDNRLLARQSRYRVDAEAVRDIALSVSGLLVEHFGGPSTRPYQPDGYLASLNFPRREYSASVGEDLYRRGLYTHWQRTFLHPSMANFDAPTREECAVNRTNSNTPLQALDLLNDPIYVEAARLFAQNAMKRGGATFNARLNWAFTQALSRKATEAEAKILSDLYQKSLQRFQAQPDSAKQFLAIGDAAAPKELPAADLAAMSTVTRAILNLHETITRN